MESYQKVSLTKDEAIEIIDRMPYIRTIIAPNDKIRNEFYDQALKSQDCIQWVKIIKSVYIRRKEKKLSKGEIQFEAMAKNLLYESLSDALLISVSEMDDYIKQYITDNP